MKGSFFMDPLAEPDFTPPRVGNGFPGTRVGILLCSPDNYLPVVGTELYDDGVQLEFPPRDRRLTACAVIRERGKIVFFWNSRITYRNFMR